EETVKAVPRFQIQAQQLPMSQLQVLTVGAYVDENNNLKINIPNRDEFEMNIEELSLQGKHNVYNNMASGLIAKVQELRNQSMKESMGSYVNISHRLERSEERRVGKK